MVLANESLGAAALVVSGGIAISASFGSTIANAVSAAQLRAEPFVNKGDILELGGPAGPFRGAVSWMGWRVTVLKSDDGILVVPNVLLTSGMLLKPNKEETK